MTAAPSALIAAILRLVDTCSDAATLLSVADAAAEAAREQSLSGHSAPEWYQLAEWASLRANNLPKGAS